MLKKHSRGPPRPAAGEDDPHQVGQSELWHGGGSVPAAGCARIPGYPAVPAGQPRQQPLHRVQPVPPGRSVPAAVGPRQPAQHGGDPHTPHLPASGSQVGHRSNSCRASGSARIRNVRPNPGCVSDPDPGKKFRLFCLKYRTGRTLNGTYFVNRYLVFST